MPNDERSLNPEVNVSRPSWSACVANLPTPPDLPYARSATDSTGMTHRSVDHRREHNLSTNSTGACAHAQPNKETLAPFD